ncbi:hypothetical protein D8B23_00980 [Verminephrobacter aporrectodeae subsp. tuberculatae]|uniref:Major Facilitator Superfamily protein n=1 Tax=Verminephrobacter aporrectodeae subsp. tuberculatae TaxID=1110392 RepID=A0ABT3KV09_9BURK|nr:hypothetical protein [Verminephrobacter aporrectodeae]MCW5321635.1 hypothetical protein [Verminephrobacter aporrectodeae subsp. tuberculatae]MCW8163546.1 hypothetical protein [Verminephrobacter aporrectodeae subsp. tuberculatae]MCW8167733.1 hypothetical protein [Verminephrobacter aporrectodeae subsp. tuberculatae]MCW8197030.1 hypothetical protein [Verminephrobacter aporrectodeae subsp. tuberculatae]
MEAIFGISALLLESGALMSGLTVNQGGWHSALLLAVVLTLATLLPAIVGGEHAPEPAFAEVAKVDLSGSGAYMGAAVLAYAGFFLMLLALGALGAQPNGPIVSGFAIFSTAFAFSAGNLLPLERLGPFRTPRLLIAAGLGLSLVGSLVLWSAIREQAAVAIVCSTALVAFGNGLTISRCFQRATLVSPDGFSGALLTMACVMIVTISLSMAAGVLTGSFQGAQVVAFGLAFVVVTLFGGFGAVRVAGL